MRYGTFKYGTQKYGKYELPTKEGAALKYGAKYRIRSINSKNKESYQIENMSVRFTLDQKPSSIRIRSDKSSFVVNQSLNIEGKIHRTRVLSKGSNPKWVESVTGTVTLKEGE